MSTRSLKFSLPALARVDWPSYTRLISTAYPPVDIFEDIADPQDWHLLSSAEGKSNPRISASIGKLDQVPVERRVGGPRSSYVMAPFTHISPDRTGRFHDGSYGAFYAAKDFETATCEVLYHTQAFLAATQEEPGWISEKRELVGSICADLHDLRIAPNADLLDPNSYEISQAFATALRKQGSQGVVYPSVRQPGGQCFAAFWPDVMSVPQPKRVFHYHWNGERVDYMRELADGANGAIYEVVLKQHPNESGLNPTQ